MFHAHTRHRLFGLLLCSSLSLVSCGGGGSAALDPMPPSTGTEAVLSARIVYQRSHVLNHDRPVRVIGVRQDRVFALQDDRVLLRSDDYGETWVDTGSTINAQDPPRGLVFTEDRVFAYTRFGHVLRSPLAERLVWTDVSVPSTTAPFLPPDTGWRPDILAASTTHLFYGNYGSGNTTGAHVYRSADSGAHWEEVLSIAEPLARHVHAVRVDPRNPQGVFVSIGDLRPKADGAGLYYSSQNGARGTFTHLSANLVGINLVFPQSGDRFYLEGDGPVGHYPAILSQKWGALSTPSPFQVQVEHAEGWTGTSIGAAMTPSQDLVWISTTENGAHGSREGVWLAMGPDHKSPRLLEDVTTKRDEWPVFDRTLTAGPYLFNGSHRIYVSRAQSACASSLGNSPRHLRFSTCIAVPAPRGSR